MGQFSDDGQWWWDGTTWIATARLVLPKLPTTEFESSGKLKRAFDRRRKSERLWWTNSLFTPLAWLTGVPLIVVGWRAMRDYRSWTLEQLALATAYLLGPDEPNAGRRRNDCGSFVDAGLCGGGHGGPRPGLSHRFSRWATAMDRIGRSPAWRSTHGIKPPMAQRTPDDFRWRERLGGSPGFEPGASRSRTVRSSAHTPRSRGF
jgi:hypothetical protein